MERNNLIRALVRRGGPILDATGGALTWPADLAAVVTDQPDVRPSAVVITIGTGDRADHLTTRLAADGGDGDVVVALLPWAATELPVGDLVQGTVAAGHQVIDVVPLEAVDTPTAMVTKPVTDAPLGVHAYMRWNEPPVTSGDGAALRLANEHAIEAMVWRTSELRLRKAERARASAEQAQAAAAQAQVEAEKAQADAVAEAEQARAAALGERDAMRCRLDRVLSSRSYRLAGRLAAGKRTVVRMLGAGRRK
jgi:hypothetical protein